jgi:hypothetical protein
MKRYDDFELLAGFGRFPAIALCNPTTNDTALIDLERVPLDSNIEAAYKARGLHFVGTFAIFDGQGRCKFAEVLDADTIAALATAYANLVLEKKKEQEKSISASWLKHLWSLVDPRQVN